MMAPSGRPSWRALGGIGLKAIVPAAMGEKVGGRDGGIARASSGGSVSTTQMVRFQFARMPSGQTVQSCPTPSRLMLYGLSVQFAMALNKPGGMGQCGRATDCGNAVLAVIVAMHFVRVLSGTAFDGQTSQLPAPLPDEPRLTAPVTML